MWIERQLCKGGQRKRICEFDFFFCFQCEVGYVELVGIRTFPWGKTDFCRPVQATEFKRCADAYIRGVSPVTVLLRIIISCKVSVPTQCQRTEVISQSGFEDVYRAVCTVLEIISRISAVLFVVGEPVIRNGYAETACIVTQCEVSYKGLSLAAWGSAGIDKEDAREIDLTPSLKGALMPTYVE